MTVKKSPLLFNATELMLWYAPLRMRKQPSQMPIAFPCIAVLSQSSPRELALYKSGRPIQESMVYIYPEADITEVVNCTSVKQK